MCIIIVGLGTECPERETLEDACWSNPDGFGWSIVYETLPGVRAIWTEKTMIETEGVNGFLKTMELLGDSVLYSVFHARIATHGTKDENNCHPFAVGGDPLTVLFHNGILDECHIKGDPRSDSAILAAEWLPQFGGIEGLRRPAMWEVVSGWARGSKLVIASTSLELPLIVNENEGFWDGNLWYSNHSASYGKYKGSSLAVGGENSASGDWWREETEVCQWCENSLEKGEWCLVCHLCQECGTSVSLTQNGGRYCAECDVCAKCGDWVSWCECKNQNDNIDLRTELINIAQRRQLSLGALALAEVGEA